MANRILTILADCVALTVAACSGPSAFAQADTTGITIAEARALVTTVAGPFKPAVGSIVIQSFDDVPRRQADVRPDTPIAVVVGDSRGAPVPGVYSNCIADSTIRTIRCDLRMLDDLIDGFAPPRTEEQRATIRAEVLQLVLAHELGHIIHGDGSAAYHGSDNGFSIVRYLHYRTELRADAFAVGLLDRYAANRDFEYGEIVELASGAVKKSLCPDTFPAACPCPGYTNAALCSRIPLGPGLLIGDDDRIPVTLTGTHPEFVVRFARLLYLSRKAHSFYAREAKQVLLRVSVRNERGQLENAATLFR